MKKLILLLTIVVFVGCAGNASMMKKELSSNPVSSDNSRIVFYRPYIFFLYGGAYQDVFVDGKLLGRIGNGDIIYIDIPEAEHQIALDGHSGGKRIKIKVKKNEISYAKIYMSSNVVSQALSFWSLEEVAPKVAIDEIAEIK